MTASRIQVLSGSTQCSRPRLQGQLRWQLFAVTSFLFATSVVALDLSAAGVPLPQLILRKVALSGDSPVGANVGTMLREFVDSPMIDNQGHVAFLSVLGGGPPASSVWISNAGLRMVAKSGNQAPDTGATFAQFSDLVISDGGIIAFKATLAGAAIGDDNRDSVWLDRAGALALVTQAGRRAPDLTTDLRFSHFETPIALNQEGQTAFFARTRDKESGTEQSSGFWSAGSSGVSLAANGHTAEIGGSPDVVFLPQSFEQPFANHPVISPNGQSIFRGFLAGPGVDESNLNGLWSYRDSDGLRLLQRAGDEPAGLGGVSFVSFPSVPTINAAGDTAFLAFFHDANACAQEIDTGLATGDHLSEAGPRLGLWLRHASGALRRIFTIGDDAPGIQGDVHFVDTFDPVMNASSHVAFVAAVGGDGIQATNEVGLWSSGMSAKGNLKLVARQGDEAPGSENGFVFGTFLEPSLNAAGQAAFMAAGYNLENGIINSAFGIWGQDRAGVLRLVAREGQNVKIGPDDYREIASLAFASNTGGEDGRGRGLNDLGQVVFRATFTDGSSGIFVSDSLTVPEAGSGTLLLLLAACLAPNRRVRSRG